MGGVYTMWGAVVAAFLLKFLPALLNVWGVSTDWLTILFGVGALQVLTTAPAGSRSRCPRDIARLGRLLCGLRGPPGWRPGAMIEVSDLTVRFGGVVPLDRMSVTFEQGTCGLIGPNGAGKTTFFNVLSGFVSRRGAGHGVRRGPTRDAALPPRALGSSPHLPDRAGDRGAVGVRERGDDPRALEEQPAARRTDVLGAIEFVGLESTRSQGGHARGAASAAWSRSRGRSSASRDWYCSTSPRPACPTRRPSSSARSSAGFPSIWTRS